jgi:YebC/PmpR family DNA-binding regulatory protein
MSGHSKWSTIKRQKGVADIKRGQTFTKLANAITIAAKSGASGDPNSNPRLRAALESAKTVNMPKDNIQRAIDKGLGKLPGQTVEEVVFEGFGPGKAAFYVEAVTDNKMRTLSEIKNMFDRSGGNLGGQGSVSYMFDKKGEIRLLGKAEAIEDQMLELIDLGAEDVEDFEDEGVQKFLVYTDPTKLNEVSNNIAQSGFNVEESAIVMKPNLTVDIQDKEIAQRVVDFASRLEDHDDIQKVYANFNVMEDLVS